MNNRQSIDYLQDRFVMPDKKIPPNKILPAPSPRPGMGADQKGWRERKGEHDGLPGVAPGVYSNLNDLPADYYHGMWRERDINALGDVDEERENRKLAQSWPRAMVRHINLRSYIRAQEYVYTQPGAYCNIVCGVFFYFRRLGLPPGLAIQALKSPWIEKKLPFWSAQFDSLIRRERFSMANASSKLLIKVMQAMDHAQRSGKLPALVVTRPISGNDIWSEHLIGDYPATVNKAPRQLDIPNALGGVKTAPHEPQPASATTMQQALFSNYQPPRSTRLPVPWTLLSFDKLQRSSLPMVKLIYNFQEGGVAQAHAILVDFTDPRHPGIFDPNVGWIEPQQGHCYFSFELTLQTLWEYYTRHNRSNPWQGLRHHASYPMSPDDSVWAYQLYEQSVIR